MTEEEHKARALVMGLIYIPWARIYVNAEEWHSQQISGGRDVVWLDADTVEPIPTDDKLGRLISFAQMRGGPDTGTYKYVFERMCR